MVSTTQEKILDLAQSLVMTGGYNGFSYADISEVIGIRKASIHHHFPTKAELVAAMVDRYTQRAQAGLSGIGEHHATATDRLDAYVGYWHDCISDASQPFCVCAMLAAEIGVLPDEVAVPLRGHFRKLGNWLAETLARGAEGGEFRLDGSAEEEAQILMAAVHGAMLSARALDNPALFLAIVAPQVQRLKA